MKHNELWEETHLLPMRVKLRRESDGSIVMHLPVYHLNPVTVIGIDKGEAIAKMKKELHAIMGKLSNV